MLSLCSETVMAANEMETDDHTHLPVSSGLRRSNSAPNISVAVLNHSTPTFQSLSLPRQRRFSVNSPNQNMIVSKYYSKLNFIGVKELEATTSLFFSFIADGRVSCF